MSYRGPQIVLLYHAILLYPPEESVRDLTRLKILRESLFEPVRDDPRDKATILCSRDERTDSIASTNKLITTTTTTK